MTAWHDDVVRDLTEALNRRDFSSLRRWADPEFVYDFTRSIGPEAGMYRGLDAAEEFFEHFVDAWGEVAWEPTSVEVLDDGRVLVSTKMNVRGRGSGLEITARGAQLLEFRDRRLVRMTMFQGRDEAAAELDL